MNNTILICVLIGFITVCSGLTQYIYGNLVKPNGLINYSTYQIDELVYNLSNRVKIYDELKHNLTKIQIHHIKTGFILNEEFYNDLRFVEDVIVNKKLLETKYDIFYFNDVFYHIKSIENVSRELYDDENRIYNNKSCLDINFSYYIWQKLLSDNSTIQYNIVDKLKMVIYNARSDLDFILNRIKWYTNEIAKYNPDIHNNFINSINELFKLRLKITSNDKHLDGREKKVSEL